MAHADPAVVGRPSGGRGAMAVLLVAVCLGWSAELLVQTILPLVILDTGGDASVVGFAAAAYAIPTLLFRTTVGSWIDRAGIAGMHRAGAVLITVAPLMLLVGVHLVYPLARFVHGLGWAMYGTANNVSLSRLAQASRRGQASGRYNAAWALGFLVGPAIGFALYGTGSHALPFIAASALAFGGFVAVIVLTRITRDRPADVVARPEAERRARLGMLFEPSALPTMLVLATFMASQALFVTFAPVYARSIGAPDSVLALYFPVYGVILAVGQFATGSFSDRVGRVTAVVVGCVLGSLGLILAATAGGWEIFVAAAAIYALAAAIVVPAAHGAMLDRIPPGRSGLSMATFSTGYQFAAGGGAILWGLLIVTVGYPAPFIGGIALLGACVLIALRFLRPTASRPATVAESG